MKPRHLARAAALALALSPLVVVAGPSHATTVALQDLDTSTPGHVTGSVTTDSPYVDVRVIDPSGRVVQLTHPQQVPTDTGALGFDLPTWGLDQLKVKAVPCSDATVCGGTGSTSTTLTATQLVPAVTWPDDTDIDPDDTYPVTVTDGPDAGGELRVKLGSFSQAVAADGSTSDVDWPAAVLLGDVTLQRCASSEATAPCTTVVTGPALRVVRRLTLTLDGLQMQPVAEDPAAPDVNVRVHLGTDPFAGTGYRFQWWVTDHAGTTVPGWSGDRSWNPDNNVLGLDLPGVTSADYTFHATVTHDDEAFGPVASNELAFTWTMDRTGPEILSHSRSGSTVAPVHDGYLDAVWVTEKSDTEWTDSLVQAVSADGSVVWHQRFSSSGSRTQKAGWAGRDNHGRPVAPGDYKLRWTLYDDLANATTFTTRVSVVSDHLERRSTTLKATAAKTLADAWAGSCSKVRKPALGGPAGSLGLYSNATCDGGTTWKRTGVATVHVLRLPRAYSYDSLSVDVSGGADSEVPGSQAYCEYWDTHEQAWAKSEVLEYYDARHGCASISNPSHFLDSQHHVAWRVVTGYGAWYDIRAVQLHLDYHVLVTGRPTTGRPAAGSLSLAPARHASDRLVG